MAFRWFHVRNGSLRFHTAWVIRDWCCPHEIDSMSAMLHLRRAAAWMQPVAKGHIQTNAAQQAPARREPQFPYNLDRDRLPRSRERISGMRRREFIAGLGGAAVWPLAARAQQAERVRRIGLLMSGDENDPSMKTWVSAFTQALAGLGWTDGRNVRMDLRWAGDDTNRIQALAQELVGLQPDVIVTGSTPATVAVQRETRTIPIVFGGLADPVASGIVARLDRPSGNTTGFANVEATLGGKWVELLLEIAPGLKRTAVMFNPDIVTASTFMPSLETAARSLKVVPITAPVHSDAEIETAITALGHEPGGGLVVIDIFMLAHRASIISAAARNNVPAVYWASEFARDGGLVSYGFDQVDNFRRAASYVDLILRGAKPAELPVQLPTKFELVVNLKTAKALGLMVPQSIVLRADEVIE
jgi:putative tryptophan/tyrosine transport system substrate-binding protein